MNITYGKKLLLLLISLQSIVANGQNIVYQERDSTFFTEFRDGCEWGYIAKNGFVVGVNNQMAKDDYGSYYQIGIIIQNLTNTPYTFDPADIFAELCKNNGDTVLLKVYTNEAFQKKIKRAQTWTMILTGLANGVSAGMAGYQTSYTTQRAGNYVYSSPVTTYNASAAYVAQTASTTQLMIMGRQMENDRKVREEGYLKKNTINSGEGIIGYMNIKKRKGKIMTVVVPINGIAYEFKWTLNK